jgi:error-prone DNA polymerase
VIVYQSAWLKYYYPAAFLVGLLNNSPMGFWPVAILVRDARRHGVRVLPVDIHTSAVRCTLVGDSVQLGLNYVLGLGDMGAQRIIDAREARRFLDLKDFCVHTRLPRRLVEHLILAGACDGWGERRRQLLWELGTLRYEVEELDLPIPTSVVDLPPTSPDEAYDLQMGLLGLSTEEHPLARWRDALTARGYTSSQALSDCAQGQRVQLIGTLVMHQAPPTAKQFEFLSVEDELGLANIIVRPHIAARDRSAMRGGAMIKIEGVVQHEGGVANVLATRVTPLGQRQG